MVVECWARNPCWVSERGRVLSSGRRSLSRILTAGQRRDMGRYPDPEVADLPGFGTGTIIEFFQIEGMSDLL